MRYSMRVVLPVLAVGFTVLAIALYWTFSAEPTTAVDTGTVEAIDMGADWVGDVYFANAFSGGVLGIERSETTAAVVRLRPGRSPERTRAAGLKTGMYHVGRVAAVPGRNGRVWVANEGEVGLLDPQTGVFSPKSIPGPAPRADGSEAVKGLEPDVAQISSIAKDDSGRLWVTRDGDPMLSVFAPEGTASTRTAPPAGVNIPTELTFVQGEMWVRDAQPRNWPPGKPLPWHKRVAAGWEPAGFQGGLKAGPSGPWESVPRDGTIQLRGKRPRKVTVDSMQAARTQYELLAEDESGALWVLAAPRTVIRIAGGGARQTTYELPYDQRTSMAMGGTFGHEPASAERIGPAIASSIVDESGALWLSYAIGPGFVVRLVPPNSP